MKQCLQSLRRKVIKELTNVYITVGLNEMAEKIGGVTARELELILIEMINQKQVSATMSITEQHVKMVHFIDQPDKNEINLEDRIFNIAAINERVSIMNKLEGLNRDFQTKVTFIWCYFFLQETNVYIHSTWRLVLMVVS